MREYSDWELKDMIATRPTEALALIKELIKERNEYFMEVEMRRAAETYAKIMSPHVWDDDEDWYGD